VTETIERGAAPPRVGEVRGCERISEYATADLAYILEIERYHRKVGGATELAPVSLRVTKIYGLPNTASGGYPLAEGPSSTNYR
jgi:hypothetical protein